MGRKALLLSALLVPPGPARPLITRKDAGHPFFLGASVQRKPADGGLLHPSTQANLDGRPGIALHQQIGSVRDPTIPILGDSLVLDDGVEQL